MRRVLATTAALIIFASSLALAADSRNTLLHGAQALRNPVNVIQLGIMNTPTRTGDASLDWMLDGAMELLVMDLAYMRGLALVPLDSEITSSDYLLRHVMPEFGVEYALWLGLRGDAGNLLLTVEVQRMSTGRAEYSRTLAGGGADILASLPQVAMEVARSIGYTPSELEGRRVSAAGTRSVRAWKAYVSALYGSPDEASRYIDAALEEDGSFAGALAVRGTILFEAGRHDEAAGVFDRALALRPYLPKALYGMARVYSAKGDMALSGKYADALLGVNVHNVFVATRRNINSARKSFDSKDYALWGADAAQQDLSIPAYFRQAFEYLAGRRQYQDMLRGTLRSANPFIRLIAISMYAESGIRTDQGQLAEPLSSPNILLKLMALNAMEKSFDRQYCVAIARGMHEMVDMDIQDEVARELVGIAINSSSDMLAKRCAPTMEKEARNMMDSTHRSLSVHGAVLLGSMGHREVLPSLYDAAGDAQLGFRAMSAIGMLATEADAPAIANLLGDPQLVYDATGLLASFDTDEAGNYIRASMQSADAEIRALMVHALSERADIPRVVNLLLPLLRDKDEMVALSAARALSEARGAESAEVMVRLLGSSDKRLMQRALMSLASRENGGAKIRAALDDGTIPVAARARALALESGMSADMLVGLLGHGEAEVRAAALSKLVSLEHEGDVGGHIANALADPEEDVRIAALRAVWEAKSDANSDLAESLLADPSARVRAVAVDIVAKLYGKSKASSIAALLKDRTPLTRAAAARALGDMNAFDEVDALIASVSDPDSQVRESAAYALGRIKALHSAEALEHALGDKEIKVRVAAAVALVRLRKGPASAYLPALAYEDPKAISPIIDAARELGDKSMRDFLLELTTMPVGSYNLEAIKVLAELGGEDRLYEHFAANRFAGEFFLIRQEKFLGGNLNILTGADDPYVSAAGHYLLAMKAVESGEFKAQLKHAKRAFSFAEKVRRGGLEVAALILQAEAELSLADPRSAMRTLKRAESLMFEVTFQEHAWLYSREMPWIRVPYLSGRAAALNGQPHEARVFYARALQRVHTGITAPLYMDSVKDIIREVRAAQASLAP